MAFTVSYTDLPDSEHGDDDTYEVLESGVLKVTSPSNGKIHYFVVDLWKSLAADIDHKSGRPKKGSDGKGRRVTVLPYTGGSWCDHRSWGE